MNKFRLHVISLPHTQTTKEYLPCAYTQKVVNFCWMMKSLGHEVFLYASEDNDADCTEFITCITKETQRLTLPSNNWKKDFFDLEWDANKPYWSIMNANAINEIGKRIQPKDFICIIGGVCQKPIADVFPNNLSVEYGIGYTGVFSKYKVFESYAWMHYIYGQKNTQDGAYYDAVIPNYFDPNDFEMAENKEDYFLFIGRLIKRKGADLAADVCRRIGAKLIMAGQGLSKIENGKLISNDHHLEIDASNIEHVGTVDVKKRCELMSKARAVFVPTQYIGPFEGVHVEAMMCGTPVITTDWGVFTETFIDGVHGYRTRTIGEMIWATKNLDKLDPNEIRRHAIWNFSIDTVRYKYQDYFEQLLTLWDKGWYSEDYYPKNKRKNLFDKK